MYKCIIIDDEELARELLKSYVAKLDFLELAGSFENPLEAMTCLKTEDIRIVFLDIQMPEIKGTAFAKLIPSTTKIIFTTAYSEYALEGFELDAIDYLLKPIDEDELELSLGQFKRQIKGKGLIANQVEGLLSLLNNQNKVYKSMYLVHHRDELIPLKTERIAYLFIENGIVKAVTKDKQTYFIEQKLEDIENDLDPSNFYRLNRQFIVQRDAISGIKQYFNGKLIVNVIPAHEERVVVSKAKAAEFKNWMNN